MLKRFGIILSTLILFSVCFSACNGESPSEIEEFLCEVFTPNTVCKRLSDGKYFFIYETYSETSGWHGELIPLENIRNIYKGNDYCCEADKCKYEIDEIIQVELTNNSDSSVCFNTSAFALEYLFAQKWYTIRTGIKSTSLSSFKNITCEAGKSQIFEINEHTLFEFYKSKNIDYPVSEDDWDNLSTGCYVPTELRPGHYRFLCPVLISEGSEDLADELVIACEFDIV